MFFELEIRYSEPVLHNLFDDTAEKIARKQHTENPEEAAEDIKDDKIAIPHIRRARDDRRKGADDRYETRDDDRFSAVFFVESVSFFQMIRIKKSRFRSGKNRR